MVFISIYKKTHLQSKDKSYEKPRGVGDLVLVFKHSIKTITTIDGKVYEINLYMDKTPFMFIPLIDDGIDESICLPELPLKDMLFMEHLLPEWYKQNSEFRDVDPTSIEKFLEENGYDIVKNILKQNELYDHVVNILSQSKVLFDGGEYHKKLLKLLEDFEYNGITFIPEDPEITEIKKQS